MSTKPGVLLFGGAFNPPHRTHREVLRAALARVPAERAIVLPTGRHPQKTGEGMACDADRLALCALAFGDLPGVTVSDRELRRPGVSYTVDTVREFAARWPGHRLFLLVGADNLRILDSWHDHHALLRLATVVTYPRPGHGIDRAILEGQDLTAAEIDELLAWVLDVDIDADDVSATAVRDALRRGENPPELTDAVAERIRALGLYDT